MERLPLFISIGSFLLWAVTALLWPGPIKTATRGVGFGFSLVQLGAAIWAAIRVFSDTTGVKWSGVWFRLDSTDVFAISFNIDTVAMVLWLCAAVFVAAMAYFALLAQITSARSNSRGEATAAPLLGLGAILTIASANFITYFFGWSLIIYVAFMAIGFSQTARDERARASFRYVILNLLPEMLFFAGILGCYVGAGTLSFSELNEKAAGAVPAWAVVCLVIGTMLRNMQIPLMQTARYVAFARSAAFPVYFIGHAILAPLIFAKIYPVIASVSGIEYLAVVPAITALAAAVLALPEEDPVMTTGWLISYVAASVFLSGLVGDFQAAQALAFTGAIAVFLFANALTELPLGQPGSGWFAMIAMVALTGVPIAGWGWARYLEYIGLMQVHQDVPALSWSVLGLKILADIVMGFALWGVARERWLTRESSSKARLDVIIPLGLIALGCLAVLTGGRPFGGMSGNLVFEQFPAVAWYERLISAPAGATTENSGAISLIGSDVDIITRVLAIGVFIIPALLGGLWLFRDLKGIADFRAGAGRIIEKAGRKRGLDSLLWDWFFNPVSKSLGRAAAFFDTRAVDFVFADMWIKPVRLVRGAFAYLESAILDRRIIDGLGEAVGTIGKSLRLVQNGQVQFYFAIGLILMSAIIVKFIVAGG